MRWDTGLVRGANMPNDVLSVMAERVAARVENKVSMDPLSIVDLVLSLFRSLSICGKEEEEIQPAEAKALIVEKHEKNPRRLRIQTMRVIRADAEEPVSREDAFELADATIAEALASTPEEVEAVCVACLSE